MSLFLPHSLRPSPPSATIIGPLGSAALLHPAGMAIALGSVDSLDGVDQFELRRLLGPIAQALPGVHLPGFAERLFQSPLQSWRNTAQQLKAIPPDRFIAAVEKSLSAGANWLFLSETASSASEAASALSKTASSARARATYEIHQSRLDEKRDLADPVLRLGVEASQTRKDQGKIMWLVWLGKLPQSPFAIANEALNDLKKTLKELPGGDRLIEDLRKRLIMTDPKSRVPESEAAKCREFSSQLAYISDLYLSLLCGDKSLGTVYRILTLKMNCVLEGELQQHREALRSANGAERMTLVAEWKSKFKPTLDDIEIDAANKKIWVEKIFQGRGKVETVKVEATDEEIINALPLSHLGILRFILKRMLAQRNQTNFQVFTDRGKAFVEELTILTGLFSLGADFGVRLAKIQAAIFDGFSHSDATLRKIGLLVKKVTETQQFWIEETARLAGCQEITPQLKRSIGHWRYYFDYFLPENIFDHEERRRTERTLALVLRHLRKAHQGRRLFVSRGFVELLALETPIERSEFLRRLESLSVTENYYDSFYSSGDAMEEVPLVSEEELQKISELKARRAERAELRRNKKLKDISAALEDRDEEVEKKVAKAAAAALAADALQTVQRAALLAEQELASRLLMEENEKRLRAQHQSVIVSQEDVLIGLLGEIERLMNGRSRQTLPGFRSPEDLLGEYATIQTSLKEAMKKPPSTTNATEELWRKTKALVAEARNFKAHLQRP